ncbi:MAG: hypothetical protein DHS20C05_06240 [Hyphococcus sp.]|nr:MAG: hypothetical protein DHS20C05_06240 [Marinicaulis sp.]
MRIPAQAHFCLAAVGLTLLAACSQENQSEAPAVAPVEILNVLASDELSGIGAPANGIAFWSHPNVAFNSLIVVATTDGLVSYNVEDRSEVSRVPGLNAQGAGVSYFGFGPQADGIVATFDQDARTFALYSIDNIGRTFSPLSGGPAVRGAIRGFCFGRALTSDAPSLFIIQKGELQVYNFARDASAPDTVITASQALIETPDNLVSCAVDRDGVVITAAEDGSIYRLDNDQSFASPFAIANITDTGSIAVIDAAASVDDEPDGGEPSDVESGVSGQLALLDEATGAVHLFSAEDGHFMGAVKIAQTDEIEGVDGAASMGANGANLGGLYRDGVVAIGLRDFDTLRLIPMNGVSNALEIETGEPVNPRGLAPVVEDNDLIINPTITID